ncbi:hypothetical protein WG29040_23410 [Pseudomonas sp. PAMC 29040]|uniref:hypothetical protein n=1 Tax=Pseudomonas sp. PAMC 29040 TaxID=2498450 RepID=UPI000FB62243|nr:hypothetical protein [Pseudomonas sp. PAMC 29040]RUT30889.1 hypothetical protein WG29040_23410 [Pseudomonas sp. PAMC 29040]
MTRWVNDMAADAQRFMDTPLAKLGLGVAQAVAAGLIISTGSSITAKLDNIQNTVNQGTQNMALVQRDVRLLEATTAELRTNNTSVEKRTSRLEFKVEQFEKERANGK